MKFLMRVKHILQLAHLKIGEWFLATPYKRWRKREEPMHDVFKDFLHRVNDIPHAKVLEVGSRDVSGIIRKAHFCNGNGYTGFDFHAGKNVDVVGDAHELSRYFERDSFDAIFSVSVFEHLAMPWKAVIEMNRVLKPGGLLFIATHPCWPGHEQPWDFWRFQVESFKVLLNSKTGFQIEQCLEGVPGKIVPLVEDMAVKTLIQCDAFLSIAVLAKKVSNVEEPFLWDFSPREIMQTQYPTPK